MDVDIIRITSEGGSGFCRPGNHTRKTFVELFESLEITNPETITKVVACGGYNDQYYSSSQINTAIADFCNIVKTRCPSAIVYIGFLGRNVSDTKTQTTVNNLFNTMIAYKNQDSAVYLTGVEYACRAKELFSTTDGFHPNEDGQKEIARAISQALYTGAYSVARTFINISLESAIEGLSSFQITTAQNGENLAFFCGRVRIYNLPGDSPADGAHPLTVGKITKGPMNTAVQGISFTLTGGVITNDNISVPAAIGVTITASNNLILNPRAYLPDGSGWVQSYKTIVVNTQTFQLPAFYF